MFNLNYFRCVQENAAQHSQSVQEAFQLVEEFSTFQNTSAGILYQKGIRVTKQTSYFGDVYYTIDALTPQGQYEPQLRVVKDVYPLPIHALFFGPDYRLDQYINGKWLEYAPSHQKCKLHLTEQNLSGSFIFESLFHAYFPNLVGKLSALASDWNSRK